MRYVKGDKLLIENTGFWVSSNGKIEVGDIKEVLSFEIKNDDYYYITFTDKSGGYGSLKDNQGDSLNECFSLYSQEIQYEIC